MKRKVFAVLMSMVMFASVLPSTVNAEECTHENSYDVEAKEPTCEEWGYNAHTYCDDCGEACKHSFFYVEKGKAPTCEEAGWTDYRYCGDCGETLQESEEIPALGHNYDENGDCLNCSFVAQVNGTKYKTLKEAVAAVEEGGTIEGSR